MRTVIVLLFSLLLFMPLAHGDFSHELIGLKVQKPVPVMCVLEPSEKYQDQFHNDKLYYHVIKAAEEWVTHLNNFNGNNNWGWGYFYYTYEDHKDKDTSFYTECDLFVLFEDIELKTALGYATYDYSKSNHKFAIIVIDPHLQVSTSKSYKVTISHMLEPCVIEKIMLHEFGHVLGIGHTITDEKSKSIMLPQISALNCEPERSITIEELITLRHIYGSEGYTHRSNYPVIDKIFKIR